MLEWLYYYTIFALSGSLVSWWSIFRPSLYLLCKKDNSHPILESKFLASIVWMGVAFICIPMLTVPLLNKKIRIAFIFNLTQGFQKRERRN